jgi:hypothetical protein
MRTSYPFNRANHHLRPLTCAAVGCGTAGSRPDQARLRRQARTGATARERPAWVGYLVLAASLSRDVWVDPADFRTPGELHVTGALVV